MSERLGCNTDDVLAREKRRPQHQVSAHFNFRPFPMYSPPLRTVL